MSWTPERRIVSILNSLDQAEQHLNLLHRESQLGSPYTGSALSFVKKAQHVVGQELAREYSLPTMRSAMDRTSTDIPNMEQVDRIVDAVKALLQRYWPNSTFGVYSKPSMGGGGKADIQIQFALWQKEDWENGIINNDPMHQHIWIWGANLPFMDMESRGGYLRGYNGKRLGKVGWRNGKGKTEAQIIRALDVYFGQKLKAAVAHNQGELDLKRQRWYEFRSNVRRASIRLAAAKKFHVENIARKAQKELSSAMSMLKDVMSKAVQDDPDIKDVLDKSVSAFESGNGSPRSVTDDLLRFYREKYKDNMRSFFQGGNDKNRKVPIDDIAGPLSNKIFTAFSNYGDHEAEIKRLDPEGKWLSVDVLRKGKTKGKTYKRDQDSIKKRRDLLKTMVPNPDKNSTREQIQLKTLMDKDPEEGKRILDRLMKGDQ